MFLSDASLFVDDAEAYEKYQREEEPDNTTQKVALDILSDICETNPTVYSHLLLIWNVAFYLLTLSGPNPHRKKVHVYNNCIIEVRKNTIFFALVLLS